MRQKATLKSKSLSKTVVNHRENTDSYDYNPDIFVSEFTTSSFTASLRQKRVEWFKIFTNNIIFYFFALRVLSADKFPILQLVFQDCDKSLTFS